MYDDRDEIQPVYVRRRFPVIRVLLVLLVLFWFVAPFAVGAVGSNDYYSNSNTGDSKHLDTVDVAQEKNMQIWGDDPDRKSVV